MKHWRLHLVWIVLAIVAGLSSWLVIANQAPSPTPPRLGATSTQLPDYSMIDAALTRYGQSGQPRYILHSDRITHQRERKVSLLTDVALDYYSTSNPYWHLTARRGRLTDGGNHVVLIGKVRAIQPTVSNPMQLSTSRLSLQLPRQLVSTEARATLRKGHRVTHGTGLKANLERGTVKLLHDVTSRYEPHED